MAKSRPRSDDDDDLGYEVVDSAPANRGAAPTPPPPKPLSAKPSALPAKPTATGKALPTAKALPAKPVASAKPAAPPPPRPPVAKSKAETALIAKDKTSDDFEVLDDEPSPKKTTTKAQADDEFEVVDEVQEQPKKKKKKPKLSDKDRERIRAEKRAEREEQQHNATAEWAAPIFLTVLGLAMIVVSAVIMSNRPGWGVGVGIMLIATFVWTLILIPIVIVSLMFIGMIAGIEYGTITNAVRSLAAITFMVNGIYWLGHLIPMGWAFAPMIASIVTFALFMMFFSLDTQETSTSLGALNIILWIAGQIFLIVVIVMIAKWGGKKHLDEDDDPPAAGNNVGKFDPGPGNGGGGRRNKNKNNDPIDFNDPDDE